MNIVKKRMVSLIIGIVLLALALLINKFNLFRAALCIIAVIILTYSAQIERSNKKVFIPLFVIIFSSLVIALDYLCVTTLKHTPIFTYSIVSSDYGKVYNALGYRVWSCKDKTFKVDPLYKLGYYCEKENLLSENINNVLSNINSDFDRYKDSYVKVIGRVTNVIDNQNFYMQAFEDDGSLINFDNKINLYVSFNIGSKEISSLKAGTLVTVVGRIDRKDNSNIYMIDSKISMGSVTTEEITIGADSNVYCEYNKELWFQTTENIFYRACVNDVNIKINDNLYNLQDAIKNNLITLDELKNESLGYKEQSKDKTVIYNYEDFKIMVCDPSYSKDVIIGKTGMDFSDGYCDAIIR